MKSRNAIFLNLRSTSSVFFDNDHPHTREERETSVPDTKRDGTKKPIPTRYQTPRSTGK